MGGKIFLVLATSGKGLFYRDVKGSASWTNITRQKTVKNGLMEIITYPTLFTAAKINGQPEYVTIGYRLKKDGKVTITILNHAMEKVKTLVSQAPRKGGGARSEDLVEDRWDGLDSQGRMVSVGTYYVRVQSSSGEGGWGKILAVAGRP
jgi:flagellar hook assembly protein FlgD